MLPNHPKSKAECISALKDLSATPGSIIRNVTDDIVMVARADDLRLIPAEGAELYADGTFQYAPRFFKQMYSFSIFKDGFYVPIVHFLLQNKTSKTYKKCIDILLDECSSVGVHLKDSLKTGHVMIDFEVAMINAIKEKLECNVFGCRFHLGQSWQRQIGKKGLATHYTTSDSPQGKWLRGLFGLSLVPSLMAKNVFERYCKTTRGRSDELLSFQNYIRQTHTNDDATLPVEMWAGLDGRATNNGAEAFHRHFGDLFGYLKTKPGIWHFLRNIEHFNIRKDIKIRSKKLSKRYLDNTNDIVLSYLRKEINVTTLLKKLSMKSKPKCALRRKITC